MQNLNKKGLSEVVQTSLLILLSISAIITMWGYIGGLTGDFKETLSPVVGCINIDSEAQSACINADGKIEVTLSKALGETITKTEFNLNGESFICGSNLCQSCTFTQDKNIQTIYLNPETEELNKNNLIVSINDCAPQQFILDPCA